MHEAYCRRVAFSPDGKILASGSDGGEIGLWEVPTGKAIRKLQAHPWQVTYLSFSPDGKHLASAAWSPAWPGGRRPFWGPWVRAGSPDLFT
jgi:WD40 repeat protein